MQFEGLVEGVTDRFVLSKVISSQGGTLVNCFGLQGCNFIRSKINGYAVRARFGLPMVVLADFMDFEGDCPTEALENLIGSPKQNLLLRFVVNELESWLLADREAIAQFLRVSLALVPANPDQVDDPKRALVNLARKGTSKMARVMIPEEGKSGVVGAGYVEAIADFVENHWNAERASENSPSLRRALNRIRAAVSE